MYSAMACPITASNSLHLRHPSSTASALGLFATESQGACIHSEGLPSCSSVSLGIRDRSNGRIGSRGNGGILKAGTLELAAQFANPRQRLSIGACKARPCSSDGAIQALGSDSKRFRIPSLEAPLAPDQDLSTSEALGFLARSAFNAAAAALIMSVLMEPVGVALASELYHFQQIGARAGQQIEMVRGLDTALGAGHGGQTLTSDSSRSSGSGDVALIQAPTRPAGEAESTVTADEEGEQEEAVVPEELVLEAWTVVKDTFLDARGAGFTVDKWEATKAQALKRGVRSIPEAHSVISSMIASLKDPYSRFLTPDQFARLAKYDITGVGLNIGDVAGGREMKRRPVVVGIVLGSPAYKAGIRQGDEIVSVDGQDVTRMSSFDVASLIQGAKGTPVSISILRPEEKIAAGEVKPCSSSSSTCAFTVLRAADAPATPVAYRMERRRPAPLGGTQEGGEAPVLTGYIRVKEFNAVSKRDLAEAVRRLKADGAQSLVLDLQDNPGGLVQAGVESAKLFLPAGSTVVYTQARGGAASERGVVAGLPPLTDIPLTVLVNGRTASASEIVAAALHDNCRAVLVGSTTFGKGLIQSVYELMDGSGLILTVGKYVTPAHQDIDGNGIKPDFRRTPGIDIAEHRLNSCRQMAQAP